MKKSIIAVIIAGALAGCSSNGSNNDGPTPEPKEGIADVIYNEELHSALITGDQGNSAAIIGDGNGNAAIKINDQAFTVQGDVIVNDQGEIVGTVTTEDGVAIANVNGISYTLSVSNGRLIVDRDKLNPEYDEPRPETTPPTYGDIVAAGGAVIIKGDNDNFVTIKADGQGNAGILINGGEQTYVVKDGELFNYDTGESVGHIQKDGENYTVRLDNGTEVAFRNDDGRLFAAVISRPDADNGKKLAYTVLTKNEFEKISILEHNESEASVLIHRDYDAIDRSTVTITDRNGNVVEFDHAQMAAAKAKALSSEQRLQIKQTIKTKLQTRS